MSGMTALAAALIEVAHKWDYATDPGAIAGAPFAELGRLGWRGLVIPPLGMSGVVGVTLSSIEMGIFFMLVLVPFALFFYWVISNLRRLRRTAHEINNVLQIIVGKDPVMMKRLQDAHRERLSAQQRTTSRPR